MADVHICSALLRPLMTCIFSMCYEFSNKSFLTHYVNNYNPNSNQYEAHHGRHETRVVCYLVPGDFLKVTKIVPKCL